MTSTLLFTSVSFPVTLTSEQAELITTPVEFDSELKRTYKADRVKRAYHLFVHVFQDEASFKPCDDNLQPQVFKDALAMMGQSYDNKGAEHFAIVANSADNGFTAYHVKTLGGRFTAHAEFSLNSSLQTTWEEALQIVTDKSDWGIRGVPSDDDDEMVCHDDAGGYNPGGCNRCHNGCRYCAKGEWSDDEECMGCLTGCPACMSDYSSDDEDSWYPQLDFQINLEDDE